MDDLELFLGFCKAFLTGFFDSSPPTGVRIEATRRPRPSGWHGICLVSTTSIRLLIPQHQPVMTVGGGANMYENRRFEIVFGERG